MPCIVLSAEQVRLLREATGPVELRDEQGRVLARVVPDTPADEENTPFPLAACPRYSGSEVQARVKKLKEIMKRDDVDECKLKEMLRKIRAGEDV